MSGLLLARLGAYLIGGVAGVLVASWCADGRVADLEDEVEHWRGLAEAARLSADGADLAGLTASEWVGL